MTSAYDRYRAADLDLPEAAWTWNLWGAGEENMGKDGAPRAAPRSPGPMPTTCWCGSTAWASASRT